MVDLNAMNDSRAHDVETVALGDEAFQIRFALRHRTCGPICRTQLCATWPLSAFTSVSDLIRQCLHVHLRPEIGESGSSSGSQYRENARGIETEEIDARLIRLPGSAHVGPHVQFRKHGSSRNRRERAEAHAAHPKWDHANPRFPVKRV